VAEIEVSEDSVGESEEFFHVNFTWGLGVNSLSSFLDPFPFFFGDGVVLGFSKSLKSNLDFIVGEGTTLVSVKSFESLFGLSPVDAFSSWFLHFFDEVAKIEMFKDSVGECVEFLYVNFTWGLGVNLVSGFLDPFPIFFGWCVALGFSKFLKSNLDFIVGEGATIVSVKFFESFFGQFPGDASFFTFRANSNGRGGSEESSNSEFHL
jgi:hypothetical protein